MEVVRPPDASTFLGVAGSLLGASEARNNLILGIAGTIITQPKRYPRHHLWVVLDADRPLAAALRTEPANLILADPTSPEMLDHLLPAVLRDDPEVPGLMANAPFADRAAEIWTSLTGARVETRFAEGLHELTSVTDVPVPWGMARPATERDVDVLVGWIRAFWQEALPHHPTDPGRDRWIVESRIDADDAGFWLWESDGVPVSMAYFGDPTPNGMRISGVYTPPEHRRRGFATALVAELSRWFLDRGMRACFLYTDLSNPTSNAIYERIGYRRVADAFEIRFSEPTP